MSGRLRQVLLYSCNRSLINQLSVSLMITIMVMNLWRFWRTKPRFDFKSKWNSIEQLFPLHIQEYHQSILIISLEVFKVSLWTQLIMLDSWAPVIILMRSSSHKLQIHLFNIYDFPQLTFATMFVCLIWFFTSHQQTFSYKETGLPG